MKELPLLLFTLCMQASVGTIIMIMVAKHFQRDREFKSAALVTALLSVAGLLASFFHLGTPANAFHAITNLGSSWMSREILFTSAFAALAVLYVFFAFKKPGAKGAINIIGWTAGVIGLIDVFMMSKIYTSSSVAVWQDASTFVEFYASVIILGAAVLFLTSPKNLSGLTISYLGIGVLTAVAVQAAFTISHYINLGMMDGPGAVSASLLSDMSGLVIAQWLFLILGAGFLLFSKIQEKKINFTGYYITGTVLCLGLIIGRYLFYAISVASRVGLS